MPESAGIKLFRDAHQLFLDGNYKESIAGFSRALDEGSEPLLTYVSRGVAYLHDGDLDRAVEDFNSALLLDKMNYRVYYYRGVAYMNKEDFECACLDFGKALDLNPDFTVAAKSLKICRTHIESNAQEKSKQQKR